MTPIIMPQIGQDSPRGKIVEWLKKENDPVAKGEVVLTVESDKAVFEITAERAGVLLKVLYPADTEVDILQPVAYIGDAGEKAPGAAPAATAKPAAEAASVPAATPSPAPAATPPRTEAPPASPAVRRLARERNVDLQAVRGTGPGGRITLQDVEAAARPAAPAPSAPPVGDTVVPFDRMRQRIADRLTQSVQTVPHFHLFIDVDMTAAQERRAAANRAPDAHLTVTDLLIKAAALSLREFPRLNAFVERDRMILKSRVNIGVATATGDGSAEGAGGLLVPVVPDADRLGLREISNLSRKISADARRGVIDLAQPATFTISSLGKYGVSRFLPIINPPEAAILAVGTIGPRLVPATGGGAAQREMMSLTLACDHRAVDGTYAARFLQALQRRLETLDGILSDDGPSDRR